MKLSTVRLYYCTKCKAILFEHEELVTIQGMSTLNRNEDGYEVEADFTIDHRDVESCYCSDCGTELYDSIALPLDIYKKLYSVVIKKETDKNKFCVELENVNSIHPEDAKRLIVAALI